MSLLFPVWYDKKLLYSGQICRLILFSFLWHMVCYMYRIYNVGSVCFCHYLYNITGANGTIYYSNSFSFCGNYILHITDENNNHGESTPNLILHLTDKNNNDSSKIIILKKTSTCYDRIDWNRSTFSCIVWSYELLQDIKSIPLLEFSSPFIRTFF